MKLCTKCKQEKSLNEFYKDKRKIDGRQSECKKCHIKYVSNSPFQKTSAQWQRDYRKNQPNRVLDKKLRRLYGITLDQHRELLERQGNCCASCKRKEPGGHGFWHVDHDHKTKIVRGLLCNRCNTGIGLLGDTVEGLQAAVAYLLNHANIQPSGNL